MKVDLPDVFSGFLDILTSYWRVHNEQFLADEII